MISLPSSLDSNVKKNFVLKRARLNTRQLVKQEVDYLMKYEDVKKRIKGDGSKESKNNNKESKKGNKEKKKNMKKRSGRNENGTATIENSKNNIANNGIVFLKNCTTLLACMISPSITKFLT